VKDGRGLKQAFPDIIPLERPDVLDDLKQFVDVHRITDFTLHDRVVPVIQLKRLEDELILSFTATVAGLAGNFSIIQLWNGTPDKILRPVACLLESTAPDPVLAFDTFQIPGASVVPTPVDRRRNGGPFIINASTVGSFRTNQAVAQAGSGSFWTQLGPVSANAVLQRVPDELLRTMALPPGTGLDFNTSQFAASLSVSLAYRVEPINKTRTGGL